MAMAQALPIAQPIAQPVAMGTPLPGQFVQPMAPVPQTMGSASDGGPRLEADDVAGCWCVGPSMGLHCYGLEAADPDTLLGNPAECMVGFPLPQWLGNCVCEKIVYHREGQTNTFVSAGEGKWIRFRSRDESTSNSWGQATSCGHPKAMKLCALPDCVYGCCSIVMCTCC